MRMAKVKGESEELGGRGGSSRSLIEGVGRVRNHNQVGW